ncbi:hypothetical protein N7449_005078 [Penicillium cf. viridicatum]|uniref:Uncharacterized protein n=1 Tax=Penicillium cf. viridicatum TaxID=2972119 RepID=A0A9W9SYP7_9EURO|nr:hypothetical protein N7449_005078 [Penicillium cf. viridicatum]
MTCQNLYFALPATLPRRRGVTTGNVTAFALAFLLPLLIRQEQPKPTRPTYEIFPKFDEKKTFNATVPLRKEEYEEKTGILASSSAATNKLVNVSFIGNRAESSRAVILRRYREVG